MLRTYHNHSGTQRQVHLGGWKRQSTDTRDEEYRLKLPQGLIAAAPTSVDLRSICSKIEDQGQLGSCTANMFAGMVEANEISQGAKKSLLAASSGASVVVSNIVTNSNGSISYLTTVTPTVTPTPSKTLVQVSRLFGYYATRKIEGSINEDSGATIRDTIKAGVTYGIADESVWPYDISKFATNPPSAVWTAASTHKVTSYHAIADGDIATMKAALAAGFLVGYGFQVYDYFMSQEMSTKAFLDLPKSTESLQGGHAQCLVGYDDTKVNPFRPTSKGAFLVRNSWGTDWGLNGYYYVSADYLKNTRLCSDFWVVRSQAL
jgi:C1A family cysteine protease